MWRYSVHMRLHLGRFDFAPLPIYKENERQNHALVSEHSPLKLLDFILLSFVFLSVLFIRLDIHVDSSCCPLVSFG